MKRCGTLHITLFSQRKQDESVKENGNGKPKGTKKISAVSQGDVILNDNNWLPNNSLPSLATKNALDKFPELALRYLDIMRGNLSLSFSAKAKIVRIFTSSTFTGKRLFIVTD